MNIEQKECNNDGAIWKKKRGLRMYLTIAKDGFGPPLVDYSTG